MDYELKCVIAFCLIVKIVALSSEYTGRERFEQNFTRAEFLRSPSLTIQTPRTTSVAEENQVMDFNRKLGKGKMVEENLPKNNDSPKARKVKERFKSDPCANVLELMQHPVGWRKIKKTLHWLDRLLASNKSNLNDCLKRKDLTEKLYKMKRKKSVFQETRENPDLEERISKDFHRDREKNSNYLIVNRARDLINSHNSNIYSERRNKKLKKGGKGKHKTRKNRSKHKGNKSGKHKLKGKGKFSHNGTHSRNKDLTTYLKPINDIIKISNDKIPKPNSVIFEPGKTFDRTKDSKDRQCQSLKWNFQNMLSKPNNCGYNLENNKPHKWGLEPTKDASTETTPKLGKPKMKNWPHFVYHRVSSNLPDPDSKNQNHRRSAYVAISVASSDSTDFKRSIIILGRDEYSKYQ